MPVMKGYMRGMRLEARDFSRVRIKFLIHYRLYCNQNAGLFVSVYKS